MSSQLTKLNGDFGREKCRDPVTVVPEQPVIEAGPYRLIQHPSYHTLTSTVSSSDLPSIVIRSRLFHRAMLYLTVEEV